MVGSRVPPARSTSSSHRRIDSTSTHSSSHHRRMDTGGSSPHQQQKRHQPSQQQSGIGGSTTMSMPSSRTLLRSLFLFVLGTFFGMQVINLHVSNGTMATTSSSMKEARLNQPSLVKDRLIQRGEAKTIIREELQSAVKENEILQNLQTMLKGGGGVKEFVREEIKSVLRENELAIPQATTPPPPPGTEKKGTTTPSVKAAGVGEDENDEDTDANSDGDGDEDEDQQEPTTAAAATTTKFEIPPSSIGFTKDDWARNQKHKLLGRDWRLDDPTEQETWKRMADEQSKSIYGDNEDAIKVYDRVALVTKVHSAHPFIGSIVQNVCLIKAAYNFHRNYPWIIFTTIPWKEKHIKRAQAWAAPANLTVVVDSDPLDDVLANMSESDRDHLIGRCDCCHKTNCCKDKTKLGWDWWCHEEGEGHATLSYLWQAEFRATHLWLHPVLKDVKHMIWIDNDALPTKAWPKDPMKLMVENELVVMFDNFPQGFCKNDMLVEKMNLAYNRSVCNIHLTMGGEFQPTPCREDQNRIGKFGLIHGMFHITDLDHYRRPENVEMNRLLTQHKGYKFSRQWDDQIAVTVVPAVTAPELAWDMRRHGLNMSMTHNGKLDGKEKTIKWAYTIWWKHYNHTWPLASRMCSDVITFNG